MSELVMLSESGGVATITFNRPEKLNAFGIDMGEQLIDAVDRVAQSHTARVLVVTGAGRAFSAGGDLGFMAALKERGARYEGLRPLVDAGRVAVLKLASLPFPTIAAVNGPAAGGSVNFALACDLRIASDRATFGQTFVRIGLHADWSGTYFLPRLVGLSRALELCWLGDMIGADEALRIGLVNRVVSHERLAEEVQAIAARLASSPQTTVRLVKQNLIASSQRTLEQCLEAEDAAQEACWNSPDSGEGIRAFAGKRKAAFGAVHEPAAATAARAQFE